MTNLILNFLQSILDKHVVFSYMFFFVSAFTQMVFPPHPGDVLLVFQGAISVSNHAYKMPLLILNSYVATMLGSICVYKLGYIKGERVLEYKFIKRFVKEKHRKKTEKLFKKFGWVAIVLSKFLLGINAIVILFAGIFKLKPRKAYLALALSSLAHHVLFMSMGRVVGSNINNIKNAISTYSKVVIISALVIAVIISIIYLLKKRNLAKTVL